MNRCKQVMVVDREKDIRDILQITLKMEGVDCCVVSSDDELLSALDHGCHPSLIILDIPYPPRYDLARLLRTDPHFSPIPLMITTTIEPTKIPSEVGSLVFLKPFDYHLFIDAIHAILVGDIDKATQLAIQNYNRYFHR